MNIADPNAGMPAAHVSAIDIACERGGRSVFTGVSVAAGPGELVAITGPNGVGKSSLLRILAGLLRPADGALSIRYAVGQEPEADDRPAVHYLGHLDGLKVGLSLAENLHFWQQLYAGTSSTTGATVADATAQTGIGHLLELPVGVLSAGQRRRAALARLLLSARPLWLLDEPTAALDSGGDKMLGTLFDNHLAAGGVVIAATHLALPIPPSRTVAMGSEGTGMA